ncbi:GDSL esterase/lipase At4g10955-like [Tasmannia lanceolata]|uniref:GDSL esterase/lipase At4g10955-like n=1 Tax=Tasmannia lanceolata TaxID=3420 RepID=UPI0040634E8A
MATRPSQETSAEGHPYDFHVSGPRNLSLPNWKDIINSSWKDDNYKRMVIACFIQAAYLLELDRQENKTEENGLAPKWWKPFKYRLAKTLIDERDGSIFGALIEWDRSAALSDFIIIRPSCAPKAVLALRGTLLNSQTIRRDFEDDFRFLAWESLKGSVRFKVALEALKSAVENFGSSNVCIAGHSLGAGFALQVGKALAKQGVFVESHLFNPPSFSLAMSLRSIGEKAVIVYSRIKSIFPARSAGILPNTEETAGSVGKVCSDIEKWGPHLYVNSSDYVCCYYTNPVENSESHGSTGDPSAKVKVVTHGNVSTKLFVTSKGPQKFLEAHGLEQWWSDDMELQLAVHNSKLINRQLRSLYDLPPPTQGKP